jgi:NB-ARC domain/WD domain, G-beta repeat
VAGAGRQRRVGFAVAAAGAFLLALAGSVMSLASNVFSNLPRWPGPLDWVRQHSLRAMAVTGGVSAGFGAVALWRRSQGDGGRVLRPGAVEGAPNWVVARGETETVVRAVLDRGRVGAVGITTGVYGAGGFGKSTVAQLVCADRRIRRRFGQRVYWVTVGWGQRSRAQIAGKVAEATVLITGDERQFSDPEAAGAHLGSLLGEAGRPVLLVLDDVWEAGQLSPFLVGAPNCVRLVTTRITDMLPSDAVRVLVDRLEPEQALTVLNDDLPALPKQLAEALVAVCGRWALLLRLANRWIAEQAATDGDSARHAGDLLARLAAGPRAADRPGAVVDLADRVARNSLVQASVQASLSLLPQAVVRRFLELGAFAADEPIPIRVLLRLWGVEPGMDEAAVRRVCMDLQRLALAGVDPVGGGAVVLHDVLHAYARQDLGADWMAVRVWDAAIGNQIHALSDHASEVDAVAVAPDGTWLVTSCRDGTVRIWDVATGNQIRALSGDTNSVNAVAVSPDGIWLATGGSEHTVRIWHVATGNQIGTLVGHTGGVIALAVAPDGTWLASSTEHIVRIWDVATGRQIRALSGHTDWVDTMAVAPDGTWLATGGDDQTVLIWDVSNGRCITSMNIEEKIATAAWGSILVLGGSGGLYGYRFKPAEAA